MLNAKDIAKMYYINNYGMVTLEDLAQVSSTPVDKVLEWQLKEDWRYFLSDDPDSDNISRTLASKPDLTDQEQQFCYHYLLNFNASLSAVKSGYKNSHAESTWLLAQPHIIKELTRLRQARNKVLFLDGVDILNQYLKIAFADLTDFVDINDTTSSNLKFKAGTFDGQVIQAISKGRTSRIQVYDKLKALDKLEQYTGALDDTLQNMLAKQKLALQEKRLELDIQAQTNPQGDTVNHASIVDALTGISTAWSDDV